MEKKFYSRGFGTEDTEAVFICFLAGIRVIEGTTAMFIEKVLQASNDCPFVLRTSLGELAVGGIFRTTKDVFKNYAVSAVLDCVKKNHEEGFPCSITPILSNQDNQSLLVVCPLDPNEDGEIHNSDKDYASLETYVRDWMNDFPGMYV